MSTTEEVCRLIRDMGKKDYTHARTLIMQMAAKEEHNGRHAVAYSLKCALSAWPVSFSTLTELPSKVKDVTWADEPKHGLNDLWLECEIKEHINAVLQERQFADQLHAAGLPLRNRLLLHGPPGNGKTSLAGAIARETGLPFLAVKLTGIVDSLMGGTGKHLNDVFSYVTENDCVLLLDEMDSIASARCGQLGADRERGLVVNQLTMLLDRVPDSSIVVGATNRADIIDPAIKRRFSVYLELAQPSFHAIDQYIMAYQSKHGVAFSLNIDTEYPSWAAVESYCMDRHRDLILAETHVTSDIERVGYSKAGHAGD